MPSPDLVTRDVIAEININPLWTTARGLLTLDTVILPTHDVVKE